MARSSSLSSRPTDDWRGVCHARMSRAMFMLSSSQFKVLGALRYLIADDTSRQVSYKSVAKLARVSQSTVSTVMPQLVEAGFISLVWNPKKGRGGAFVTTMLAPPELQRAMLRDRETPDERSPTSGTETHERTNRASSTSSIYDDGPAADLSPAPQADAKERSAVEPHDSFMPEVGSQVDTDESAALEGSNMHQTTPDERSVSDRSLPYRNQNHDQQQQHVSRDEKNHDPPPEATIVLPGGLFPIPWAAIQRANPGYTKADLLADFATLSTRHDLPTPIQRVRVLVAAKLRSQPIFSHDALVATAVLTLPGTTEHAAPPHDAADGVSKVPARPRPRSSNQPIIFQSLAANPEADRRARTSGERARALVPAGASLLTVQLIAHALDRGMSDHEALAQIPGGM